MITINEELQIPLAVVSSLFIRDLEFSFDFWVSFLDGAISFLLLSLTSMNLLFFIHYRLVW